MNQSTITSKYQTTIPREVRERLGLSTGDVLRWDVLGDHVRVTAAAPSFLRRQGSIRVGSGSAVEDVQRARKLRGTEKE